MRRFGMDVSSETSLKNRLDGRIALLGQNPEHHFIASTVAEDIVWGLSVTGRFRRGGANRATEVAKALCVDHLLSVLSRFEFRGTAPRGPGGFFGIGTRVAASR